MPLGVKTACETMPTRSMVSITFTSVPFKKETVAERLPALHIKSMSEHKVTLKWERGGADFSYQKYPRDHTWSFDGGHTMTATAAPAYLGNPANVDPEEGFRSFTRELSHAHVPVDCL